MALRLLAVALCLAALPGLVPGGLGAFPSPLAAQEAREDRPAPPCSDPAYDDFDFWVGTWDVHGPDGTRVGRNVIRKTMGGCVLHESYDGREGYHGESFNTFDRSREVWHQTWVDNGGLLLRIEGGLRNGAMVLEGVAPGGDGRPAVQRITWSVLEGERERPERVRQLWEASTDDGATWTVVFDGEYRRAGG